MDTPVDCCGDDPSGLQQIGLTDQTVMWKPGIWGMRLEGSKRAVKNEALTSPCRGQLFIRTCMEHCSNASWRWPEFCSQWKLRCVEGLPAVGQDWPVCSSGENRPGVLWLKLTCQRQRKWCAWLWWVITCQCLWFCVLVRDCLSVSVN